MKNKSVDTGNFFKTACIFEGSLIIVASLLGWVAGIDPFADLIFTEPGLMNGLLATLPLLALFFAMQQLSYLPIQNIKNLLQETLGAQLYRKHWTDLLILASIAGISEEILFRGFLQPWMEQAWSNKAGLVGSNIVFALVHSVTPLYGLLAMLIGLYLGMSLDYGGERNLLTPITIHTAYDFVVFIVIMHNYRKRT